MKNLRLMFLLAAVIGCLGLKAATPEAIYIATWETMSELGKAITPSADDPKLEYNESTGCYEGQIIDWPRLAVNPYNAKIPYSVENDVITYYGVAGSTQQFSFNNSTYATFTFTTNTDPSSFKGFGISMVNSASVEDVRISIDLATSEITFTKFESGEGAEIPTLLSIDPENGSELTPETDGDAIVTLSFSGEVTSMDVVSDGVNVPSESNEDGSVWSIIIPAERISATSENSGILTLTVQKVFSGNLPVSFENGSPVLSLTYSIAGVTKNATIEFEGTGDALATLKVYKAPEFTLGDEVDFENNELSFTYTENVTYLFTVGSEYEINVISSIDSDNSENWKLGEGNSYLKGANGEATNIIAAKGLTLTLYPGASGAVFKVTVNNKNTGVGTLRDDSEWCVYSLSGTYLFKTNDKKSLDNLEPGIYVINGKKVIIK